MPTWGTLIALQDRGRGIIGVLDQPFLRERFVGHGEGAYLGDRQLAVRSCPDLSRGHSLRHRAQHVHAGRACCVRCARRAGASPPLRGRLLRLRNACRRLRRSGGRGEHEHLGHRCADSHRRGRRRHRDLVGVAAPSAPTAGCSPSAIAACTRPRSKVLALAANTLNVSNGPYDVYQPQMQRLQARTAGNISSCAVNSSDIAPDCGGYIFASGSCSLR